MIYILDKINDVLICNSRIIPVMSFAPLQIIRKPFFVRFPTSSFIVSISDPVTDPGFTTPHTSKHTSREVVAYVLKI
jgi:hypothetical protein